MGNEHGYNGWTNYETWRINLEMFDGAELDSFGTPDTLHGLADALQEYAEMAIKDSAGNTTGLAYDYAMSFISSVDWREIALAVGDGRYNDDGDLMDEE